MMDNLEGTEIIQELLTDPARFYEQGRGYQLLEAYFDGLPIETLRPLLNHKDRRVRREVVWVASELGREARSLIHDAIPLIYDGDPDIQYYALEIVMVCSFAEHVEHFVHVVRSLQSDDKLIRGLAMYLVSNAEVSQLEAGVRLFGSPSFSDKLHKQGLSNLLKDDILAPEQVLMMIDDKEPLVRKYGTIAAKRLIEKFPKLIANAISSADPEVRKFSLKVCFLTKNVDHFVHVIRSLQSNDELMRIFAMHYVSGAQVSKLEAAYQLLETPHSSDKLHKQGLSNFLKGSLLEPENVLKMIDDKEPLIRKYGAIAARRLIEKFPELIATAIKNRDNDVCQFSLKECSFSENDDLFVFVVPSLQSNDEVIRILVMQLMSKAYFSQLEAAARLLETHVSSYQQHKQGLSNLLKGDIFAPEQVLMMIDDKEPLVRKYGAIAAKRLIHKFPELIAHAAASSMDFDVCKFSQVLA